MLALLTVAALAQPCTVTVYSYQTPGRLPAKAHTWAVFSRGGESVCISWMPAGNTRLLTHPQPGVNWTHAATLAYARQLGARVKRWGPYRARSALFDAARQQAARLAGGQVLYAELDALRRGGSNCVHAAASPAGPLPRPLLYGFAAGQAVARHFRPFLE